MAIMVIGMGLVVWRNRKGTRGNRIMVVWMVGINSRSLISV